MAGEIEAGLAAIIRATFLGTVIVRRRDGVILEANEAFSAGLGWTRDELIGRTTAQIELYVDPTTRTRIYEAFERDGKVTRMEVLLRARSGTHAMYRLTMHPLTLGGEACAVAFWEDVTEIRRVDAALQRSEDQLRAISSSRRWASCRSTSRRSATCGSTRRCARSSPAGGCCSASATGNRS